MSNGTLSLDLKLNNSLINCLSFCLVPCLGLNCKFFLAYFKLVCLINFRYIFLLPRSIFVLLISLSFNSSFNSLLKQLYFQKICKGGGFSGGARTKFISESISMIKRLCCYDLSVKRWRACLVFIFPGTAFCISLMSSSL